MTPDDKREARERRIKDALAHFDQLPDGAFLRVGAVARLRGCGPATIWRHARAGTFPAAVRLPGRSTGWRVGEVREYLKSPATWAQRSQATA